MCLFASSFAWEKHKTSNLVHKVHYCMFYITQPNFLISITNGKFFMLITRPNHVPGPCRFLINHSRAIKPTPEKMSQFLLSALQTFASKFKIYLILTHQEWEQSCLSRQISHFPIGNDSGNLPRLTIPLFLLAVAITMLWIVNRVAFLTFRHWVGWPFCR